MARRDKSRSRPTRRLDDIAGYCRSLGKQNETKQSIEDAIRILAPLEFWTHGPDKSAWQTYFAPRLNAENGREEYPCLSKLGANEIEEWAGLSRVLKRAAVRARFADAVWELGRRLNSPGTDFHIYGQLAAELYLEAADANITPLGSFSLFEILTRSISLSLLFRRGEMVERGFQRMVGFAAAADQAHIGLWTAPFDRLMGMKGLSDAQRGTILQQLEARLQISLSNRDLHQIKMAGDMQAKYFHDQQIYKRATEITAMCNEVVLDIAVGMNAGLATHHLEDVMLSYRRLGLSVEADRVHVLLEQTAKISLAEMKPQRISIPIDRKRIDDAIAERIDVPHPLEALFRLAEFCVPRSQDIKKQMADGGFIAHRIVPTALVGDHGLPVTFAGTEEDDIDEHVAMRIAEQMNFNSMVFSSGIDEWKKKFEVGALPDAPDLFNCPLIPPGRASLYSAGLAAFDAGNYIKCIHVLVPQIENSLRELLLMLGGTATKTRGDGTFDLKNMNDVLHEECVQEAIDENLWCFFTVLYADKRGMNLRNLVAHGIAAAEAFNPMTASLVVQSVALLSMIRPDGINLPPDATEGSGPE